MAQNVNVKIWDAKPSFSNRFKITTKYTDLGNPDSMKSILGVMLNLSVETESTASSHNNYTVIIKYRTSPSGNFKTIDTFSSAYNPSNVNQGNIEIVKMLPTPIKDILNLQLQIKGQYIRGDFGINDFGLIFRTYKTSNVVTLNED